MQLESAALGLDRQFPTIGPANVKGIEINPYAAELARVSVWIGEIQWMQRNGFAEARDPILQPLDTIECRDAVLTLGRQGAGLAGGGRRDRQSAVSGYPAPGADTQRGLCLATPQGLRRARAGWRRYCLLLVREGRRSDTGR